MKLSRKSETSKPAPVLTEVQKAEAILAELHRKPTPAPCETAKAEAILARWAPVLRGN